MRKSSLLWKLSQNNLPDSYLFGTVHLLPKAQFFIPDKIKNALLQSDNLWIEIDITNSSEQEVAKKMMQNNISLKEAFSSEEYNFLSDVFKKELQQEISNYQFMQPIFILYLYLQHKMQGKTISYENELCSIANSSGIKINGLSSAEEQYNYGIEAVSYKDLLETFVAIQHWDFEQVFIELMQYYQTENLVQLTHWIEKYSFQNTKIHSILLEKRNLIWTERITKISTQNSHFFAIGAAHLLGKTGMISLLKNKGFCVEAIF